MSAADRPKNRIRIRTEPDGLLEDVPAGSEVQGPDVRPILIRLRDGFGSRQREGSLNKHRGWCLVEIIAIHHTPL